MTPPATDVLRQRLSTMLAPDDPGGVQILERTSSAYSSTFLAETVTCLLPDGRRLPLFVKYVSEDAPERLDRQVPPSYEATVYRDILQHVTPSSARFYGAHDVEGEATTWLVLEHVEPSEQLSDTSDPLAGIQAATAWLVTFHGACRDRLADPSKQFLQPIDDRYLQRCLERLHQTVGVGGEQPVWLDDLLGRAWPDLVSFLSDETTVVHGEFYPDNILLRDGLVYPVDWESAALGPGALDLAALIDGWDEDVRRSCVRLYAQGADVPVPEVQASLDLADLYWRIWWLSHPEWGGTPAMARELRRLHRAGQRLGMV